MDSHNIEGWSGKRHINLGALISPGQVEIKGTNGDDAVDITITGSGDTRHIAGSYGNSTLALDRTRQGDTDTVVGALGDGTPISITASKLVLDVNFNGTVGNDSYVGSDASGHIEAQRDGREIQAVREGDIPGVDLADYLIAIFPMHV